MKLPETPAARLALDIAQTLLQKGFQAFLVGGCVRDLLLGNSPPKDFDIATDATPDQLVALFPRAGLVGAHFGVVQVRNREATVEVATFRTDHAYRDGRHPASVEYQKDPREDVLRRDFTINALLLHPVSFELLDYVGGRADLDAGVIRTVGDPERRFAEDHLRMLRAVRFAARLGFVIEPATAAAIRGLKSEIRRVSPERIRDELLRILTEGGSRRGFEMLDETGLLNELLPEVAAMKGVAQPPQYHPEGDVWTHTLLMLEALRDPTPTLALGVLLHDVGKPPTFRVAERIRFDGHADVGAKMAVNILRRLNCSREQIDRVEALVRDHLRFMHVREMRQSTLKRFLRAPNFEEYLELHRLDCLSSHRRLENYWFAKQKFEEMTREELRPVPLISGRDLIAAGYTPGPAFHGILHAVETAQLESALHTPTQALVFVRSRFIPPDGRPASKSATADT